ncbi:MAG: fumarate hydratase [Clostridia bacterium]|nr:fumarate hydratase [Clostridia bacterium]
MREIRVDLIANAVSELCQSVNYELSPDMERAVGKARLEEKSEVGKNVLGVLEDNLAVAKDKLIPICQDTGMAVVFLDVGQEVSFCGGYIEDAVNEGVRRGYTEGYLRKSVVSDPFERVNTGDNTPAIIHTRIVPGDKVKITVAPKGFGSENMSRIFMLKPSDGAEGVKRSVVETVRAAGPNACPPLVVGVGVGGDFELCAIMAKRALTREVGRASDDEKIAALEREILDEINALKIGPAGLGGDTTALAVNIETYPTHIAGLPCAVNICCHVNRHASVEL